MKIRLRSTQSKETLKIEAPSSCSLFELKQILSQTLPGLPHPASIRLSLNRKDELQSDGGDSIHFLGITAGDLIFYSLEQPAASTGSIAHNMISMNPNSTTKSDLCNSECSTSLEAKISVEDKKPGSSSFDTQRRKTLDSDSRLEETGGLETQNTAVEVKNSGSSSMDTQKIKILDSDSRMEETGDHMEVDGEGDNNPYDINESLADVDDKSFSVPGFLRKVLAEELGNDNEHYHKLIVIAVHAVLLESGFIRFDPSSNMVINGFHCRDSFWSHLFSLSLHYTLPEIGNSDTIHTVVLKFQSLGKFINVYGSLSGGGSGKTITHLVRLNEDQLVPFLNVVWANCGVKDSIDSQDGSSSDTSPEKEVFKFWRNVKDNLALPLMIDICDKAGFDLPPCFMRLPTDIKLKIMESMPGDEIAKLSCTCSELRYLASSDEVWKLKYGEEFGKNTSEGQGSWKRAFVRAWEMRMNSRRFASRLREPSYFHGRRGIRYGRPPFVPQFPGIIGGDYDMWPNVGNNAPFAPEFPGVIGGDHDMWPNLGNNMHARLGDPANRLRLNVSPHCDLGGLGR